MVVVDSMFRELAKSHTIYSLSVPSCIPSHAHVPSVSAPEHVRGCRWPGQACVVRGVCVRGRERGRGIERHAGAARPHPAGWMGRVTLQKHARKESGKPRGGVGMRDVAKGRGLHLCWVCGVPPGSFRLVDALPRAWSTRSRARGPALPVYFWSHGE